MLRSTYSTRTEPTVEPVTVDELRAQLLIEHTDQDAELAELLTAVRREAEELHLSKVLIQQTCVDRFDAFDDEMELRWAPVSLLPLIEYVDTNGTLQTLADTVYELGTRNGVNYVRLKYDQAWPSTRGHEDAVTITYVAGYGTTAASVPVNIRRWIKCRAAYLHYNRDGEDRPWPTHMNSLLSVHAMSRVH